MTLLQTSQIIGTVSIFIIFCLKFWIAVNPGSSKKTLRVAILWFSIYVFFLFVLRLFQLFNLSSSGDLRIISGLTTPIPLIGIIVQLVLDRKIEEKEKEVIL